jgi:hypothetical protein
MQLLYIQQDLKELKKEKTMVITRKLVLLDLTATENGLLKETIYRAQVAVADWGAPPFDIMITSDEYEELRNNKESRQNLELTILPKPAT